MIKILKWAYNRGVQRERLRIKLLIYEFEREITNRQRSEYYIRMPNGDKRTKPNRTTQVAIDNTVHEVLERLTLKRSESVEAATPAPIDEAKP